MGMFNPFKRKDWEKKGREMKKKAEKAGKKLDPRKAKGRVEHTVEEAKDTLNPQRVYNEVEKRINGLVDQAEGRIKKLEGDVKQEVLSATDYQLERLKKEADKALRAQLERIEQDVEKVAESVVNKLTNAVSKEGLKKVLYTLREARLEMERMEKSDPELVDDIDALGFDLGIGPVGLSYSNFYSRAIHIEKSIEDLTKRDIKLRRSTMIQVVSAFEPDSIDLGIDVELAALVISSNSLGIRFKLKEIRTRLGNRLLGVTLKKIGVPE